jgi:hypothetical protein
MDFVVSPTLGGTSVPRSCYAAGGTAVGKTLDKQIEEIEETQEALRESIKEAESLADKAQELLQKHKKTIERKPD